MTFESNVHKLVWGTESWEISVHPSSPVVIKDGNERGKKLSEVFPSFPLLVKVIDAKDRLSLQVHPNEKTSFLTGGEPKTEMWCLLEDGLIYAGLKSGVTSKDVLAAVSSGGLEELLVRHEAKKGEVYFIPGGLVHAIGENTKIYEVQQSSNTTYRLFDWGRVDAGGKPRELHLEKSLLSIDYSLSAPIPQKEVKCRFFSFKQECFESVRRLKADKGSFLVVYDVLKGKSVFLADSEEDEFEPGYYFITSKGE